jgi:RNA polymerase sigma-70 factor (ECF subfamily)
LSGRFACPPDAKLRSERAARASWLGSSCDATMRVIENAAGCIHAHGSIPMPFETAFPNLPADCCRMSAWDSARLGAAFVRHYAGIWRFLRRMGVSAARIDDAAQHVFLVAAQAIPRIVSGSERAFLYSTAVRVAHGLRRRAEREIPDAEVTLGSSSIPSADELTDQKRARVILDALLDRMEIDARTVFVLFEIDGFTAPEIAGLLGLPLGTVASRLRRAREQFHLLVEELTTRPGAGR